MNIKFKRELKATTIAALFLLTSALSIVVSYQAEGTTVPIHYGTGGNTLNLTVDAKIWCEEKQEWLDKVKIIVPGFGDRYPLHFRCIIRIKSGNFTAIPLPGTNVSHHRPMPIEDLSEIMIKNYLPLNLRYIEGSSNYPVSYDAQNNILMWKLRNNYSLSFIPESLPNKLIHQINITFDVYPVYAGVGKNYFTVSVGAKNNHDNDNVIGGSGGNLPENVVSLPGGGYMVYDEDTIGVFGIDRFVSIEVYPKGAGRVEISSNKSYFVKGDKITLYAIPNEGYVFDHWSGDLYGEDNPAEIIVDSRKNVTAYFRFVGTANNGGDSTQNNNTNYSIEIMRPREHRLYIFDRELFRFPRTLVIGPIITTEVNASDGIAFVAFYVDDELQFVDYERPFVWNCIAPRGFRSITVLGFDSNGTFLAADTTYLTWLNLIKPRPI